MTGYTILNSRKRVIVALVHSIFFLAVAMAGLFTTVAPLGAESHAGAWGIAGIYVTVSAILGWLTAIAGAENGRISRSARGAAMAVNQPKIALTVT